jgi:hypothetical protein
MGQQCGCYQVYSNSYAAKVGRSSKVFQGLPRSSKVFQQTYWHKASQFIFRSSIDGENPSKFSLEFLLPGHAAIFLHCSSVQLAPMLDLRTMLGCFLILCDASELKIIGDDPQYSRYVHIL